MEHGGNLTNLAARAGCRPEELLDFSVNLNPLGPPPGAFGLVLKVSRHHHDRPLRPAQSRQQIQQQI